jgi:DNA invertase Pin-like site-specific DNA recombinase
VVKVFKDDASGSLVARPAMQEMLAFLKSQRKESYVVIIDDISRLARGLDAHLRLRAALSAVGARLESPSIEFGEDSDSVLVENLLASVSQHQRQKNGEQTKNRMRAGHERLLGVSSACGLPLRTDRRRWQAARAA